MPEYRLHGPPGCGKTTSLARSWLPRAAERHGSDAVLVCSLTRTAAREIASRNAVPRERVGTLHAHAYRALGRPELSGNRLELWNARWPALALSGSRNTLDGESPAEGSTGASGGDPLQQAMEVYRHRRTPRERWREDVRAFAGRWEEWKAETCVSDFTDLIETCVDEGVPAPGAPRVLIVDEAQDSSSLELALVRRWGAEAESVVLAGDGDQAIYGWRGADARAFLTPAIPEDQNYRLTQSYRVPRAVHAAAARWIGQASFRFAVEYHPRDAEGTCRRGAGSSRYAEPMVAEVLDSLGTDDRTTMLIASCEYMLRPAIKVLRRAGVLFHNPWRVTNGAWNPLRGGVERLRDFLRPDPRVNEGHIRLWTLRELHRWVELIRSDRLPTGAKREIKRRRDAQERREDLPSITVEEGRELLGDEVWGELLVAFASSDARPEHWLKKNLLASKQRLMDYAFQVAHRGGPSALFEKPRLIVGTIHSVKGGEADAVHLMPDLSPSGMRQWTRVGDERDAVLRQFYVGMTRAKDSLVVHQPGGPFCVQIQ